MSAMLSAVNASLELYDGIVCREKTARQIDDAHFMQSLEQIIGREEGVLVLVRRFLESAGRSSREFFAVYV